MKILKWIVAFIPTAIGFLEVVVKFVKELATLIVDILYPIIPSENFKNFVTKMRGWIEAVYTWLSNNKEKILSWLELI